MAKIKRDPVTGKETTGHEWNGIEELDSPVPKVVLLFLAATIIFSVACWILLPTFPLGKTYTKGVLGTDQRKEVAQKVAAAQAQRQEWASRIESMSYEQIMADPELMKVVKQTGHTLFQDNCAACHGMNATGGPGFPDLTAKKWLWGGTPEQIAETINVGINGTHADTRVSQMLAFGRDGMLTQTQILDVATYVQALSQPVEASPERLAAGAKIFAEQCATCHGDNGKGKQDVGAPDLTDNSWIYGGDLNTIYKTIYGGRQGQMPSWEGRLSPLDLKLLTVYVSTLPEAKK